MQLGRVDSNHRLIRRGPRGRRERVEVLRALLFNWLAPGSSAGNLTVTAPAAAVSGAQADITIAWSGPMTGTRYLGFVQHGDGTDEIGRTIVSIRTD